MSIKNLWALNVDEALVADRLKNNLSKSDYEVFFPVNMQMKDIDLLLVRLSNYKTISIQVKGSRTYEPSNTEVKKYGDGSAAWIKMSEESIFSPTNKVSTYVFVLHSLVDTDVKKSIEISYLVIPARDLIKIARKKTLRKGEFYHFFIWVDSNNKRAFDFNNPGDKSIQLSRYFNNWDYIEK